jgi:hypothetical protein
VTASRELTPAIRSCLFVLPLWHPVLVAEQIGAALGVDLAEGRYAEFID